MEPAMMNIGVVPPEPGYLEAVREITKRHGVLLIFDEVKTGLVIAAGGATERFGITPDLITLAKALGGVRAPRADRRAHPLALPGSGSPPRPAGLRGRRRGQGLRHLLLGANRRLRDVQGEPGRRADRARLALQPEPRDLHDPRSRGGVDALGRARRGSCRRIRRRLRRAQHRPHRLRGQSTSSMKLVPGMGLKRYGSMSRKLSEAYSARAAAIAGTVSSLIRA